MQLYATDTSNRIAGEPRGHWQNALDIAAVHYRDVHMIKHEIVAGDASPETPFYGQVRIELLAELEEGDAGHHGGEALLLVIDLAGVGADIEPVTVIITRAVVAVGIGRHSSDGNHPGENQSERCDGLAHRHLREITQPDLDLASDMRMVEPVPCRPWHDNAANLIWVTSRARELP